MRFLSSASLASGGLSQASRFSFSSLAASEIASTRGSSTGSVPGAQGNGNVSNVVVGV